VLKLPSKNSAIFRSYIVEKFLPVETIGTSIYIKMKYYYIFIEKVVDIVAWKSPPSLPAHSPLQVCRALELPLSSHMFREVLTRLAESASDQGEEQVAHLHVYFVCVCVVVGGGRGRVH